MQEKNTSYSWAHTQKTQRAFVLSPIAWLLFVGELDTSLISLPFNTLFMLMLISFSITFFKLMPNRDIEAIATIKYECGLLSYAICFLMGADYIFISTDIQNNYLLQVSLGICIIVSASLLLTINYQLGKQEQYVYEVDKFNLNDKSYSLSRSESSNWINLLIKDSQANKKSFSHLVIWGAKITIFLFVFMLIGHYHSLWYRGPDPNQPSFFFSGLFKSNKTLAYAATYFGFYIASNVAIISLLIPTLSLKLNQIKFARKMRISHIKY